MSLENRRFWIVITGLALAVSTSISVSRAETTSLLQAPKSSLEQTQSQKIYDSGKNQLSASAFLKI